jgi:hypothetical protein
MNSEEESVGDGDVYVALKDGDLSQTKTFLPGRQPTWMVHEPQPLTGVDSIFNLCGRDRCTIAFWRTQEVCSLVSYLTI